MAISTGDKVTRKYENFRGVDFRGDECAINRSPDALNVWRNYRKPYGIETRPALKHIFGYSKRITSMKWHGNTLLFFADDGQCHQADFKENGEFDSIGNELYFCGNNGFLFKFGDSIYALGNADFTKLSGSGENKPFIPTTSIGSLPSGAEREIHQAPNMLTPYRINTFRGDDESFELHLDTRDVDHTEDDMPQIKIDGKPIFSELSVWKIETNEEERYVRWYFGEHGETDKYIRLFYHHGVIEIQGQQLTSPYTDGQDNISVQFKKTVDTYKEQIYGCTMAVEFDNRIFLSGNKDYPNKIYHSSLDNPFYFADNDIYVDGRDDGKIKQMVSGNDALWVFRDTQDGNGVYYHTAVFDDTYGKVYPSAHSNIAISCVGGAINFLDDIVFFSPQGMESITQNITKEQFAIHKSSLVDRLMLNNTDYKDMVLAEWDGYLLVCIGTDVFLADSRAILANENHYEYEWYHWNLGEYKINCAAVKDGVFYIATDGENDDGVILGNLYKLDPKSSTDVLASGIEKTIESYWTTPKDKFGTPNKVKTTNKKGFVAEATGDVHISTRVDGEADFDEGEEFQDVTDHIVTKVKRKKFKDIQIKFYSKTRFSLESAALEAFIGGYIKR